jgi:hypothetical protein
MRLRSPRWATVDLAGADFRALAQPFHSYLELPSLPPACPF